MKALKNIWKASFRDPVVEVAIPVLAVFTALACGAVLIRASGASITDAYGGLVAGMFGSKRALIETCVAATPYILTGLSVALGFQCGLFNIGAEGQFYMGSLCSVVVGFGLHGLPTCLHIVVALLAGFVGGALWGAIPGIFKARFGSHEVITTIMMNYIGVNLSDLFVKKLIRDPLATVDRTPYILQTAQLPKLFGSDYRLHIGFLIALGAVVLTYWFLKKTTFGFEIRTTGSNPTAARYAGMRVGWTIVLVMTIAGGLAGLAGAGEVLGLKHNLPATFSRGYGYDAIAVAFLARSNPLGVLPAAFLWGGLRNGAGLMQIRSGISIDLINVIQALVIVFIAADPIIRWLYRIAPRRKIAPIFSRGWGK
ncbi:ABC transporter permease [Thermodesulfobacteriota bacterium]